MGERCVIRLEDSKGVHARVYLHWGGERFDDVRDTMLAFMEANASNPNPRWDDMPYLAARFLVWAVEKYGGRGPGAHPLNFLSVGLVDSDAWGDFVGVISLSDDGALDLSAGPTARKMDQTHIGTFWDGDLADAEVPA